MTEMSQQKNSGLEPRGVIPSVACASVDWFKSSNENHDLNQAIKKKIIYVI